MKRGFLAAAAALGLLGSAAVGHAAITTVDLSPYVNEGFTNAWFINGGDFTPLVGTTNGNQGSPIPFDVANPSDGNGGNNNFWYGLYSGPGSLSGPPGSVTIPVAGTGVQTVYTLADNTFGSAGTTEFSITFTGAGGSITDNYVGGDNTKDYNFNTSTTGAGGTPNAAYWYIDPNNGGNQWLQVQTWSLPSNFGLTSVTFNQVNGGDGAIVAGLTLSTTAAVPEPETWALMLLGVGAIGASLRFGRRKNALALAAT